MNTKKIFPMLAFVFLFLNLISALVVNADYITTYPGEEGKVIMEIENNENFDIEDISVSLDLDDSPFTVVGNSEKNIEELDEDDDDSVTFTLKSSTDITPGDYNILYTIKYFNSENSSIKKEKTGSFGLRVSARTELDFGLEIKDVAVIGNEGRISLEIINKGLGEIKSASVQIFPNGFELLSKDKIFIGSIDSDDTDIASFDVIYKTSNPVLSAKVDYKDFDNNEQSEIINLPIKVYATEEALKLGLIKKNYTGVYILVLGIFIVGWITYRKIKKRRKRKERNQKEISGR